jgi:methionyl-tRNA formyltransferase
MNWAMINGEKEVGITLHLVSDTFDEGPIVDERCVDVSPDDDINDLDRKVAAEIPDIFHSLEQKIRSRMIVATCQPPGGTHYRARKPKDGMIDVTSQAQTIHNKIRALAHPWPGAYLVRNEKKLVIWRAGICKEEISGTCGDIVKRGRRCFLIAGDHRILAIECMNDPRSNGYKPVKALDIARVLHECNVEVK